MTEYPDILMEEMASEFIVATCQLLPKSYDSVSDCMHNPMAHAVHCGSAMEFYIRPLTVTCITDTDSLGFSADKLAFEGDFLVLTHDVSLLRDTIKFYKIEPYFGYPGFVRLRSMGQMKYNWKYKRYELSHRTFLSKYCMFDNVAEATNQDLTRVRYGKPSHTVRGPAITTQYEANIYPMDDVHSIWCPQWPREAKEWPRRLRNCGWPTIGTISEVVQHGCHVVYVQHRACRDDEQQWRLSFSVAEIILLQSWTPVQQIVYHLLRIFVKREIIQKDCLKEDEVLCPYHLKTLMLWTCEETSPEWWNSSSVIAIACLLLRKLSEWLWRRYCPNYFIPEANLFNLPLRSTRLEKTKKQLKEFCKSGILCNWFVENYIMSFTRTYIEVGNTRSLMPNFVDYILPIIEFQQTLKFKSLDYLFSRGILYCNIYIRFLINFGTNLGPRSCLSYTCLKRKSELIGHGLMSVLPVPEDISCFTLFDTALCSLNAAYGIECGKMAWDKELFVEYIKGFCCKPISVRCKFHRLPNPFIAEGSQFQFWRAQDLMGNLTGLNSPSECQLLSLLSKGFLRKALKCDDSQSNGIAPAAVVYLAALHFASSEIQITIDLCSAVLMVQVFHVEDETLNAGCLFFIDDVVRVVGFCLLCKKFNENKHFFRRQIYLDLRLTPMMFAYYLIVKCVRKFAMELVLNPCLPTSAFPLDLFLLTLTKRQSLTLMMSNICPKRDKQCVYRRTQSVTAHAISSINLLTVTDKIMEALSNPKCIPFMKSGTHLSAVENTIRRKDSLKANVVLPVNLLTIKETAFDILIAYALEHITTFYDAIREGFGIKCNTADCYRALCLYKCRQYDDALHLCEEILKEPDLQSDFKDLALANVLVVPSLHLFFDTDVQSLLGFHSLFWCLPTLDDKIRKFDKTTESKFLHFFVNFCALFVYCSTKPLLYCFSFPDSIKCHYSVGRHFLANI